MIVLRDYQKRLYDDIHSAWSGGARNVLAVAPTGSGKTSTFAKVIHDHPGASIAIAHRNELVSQISMSLARNGVRHRIIGQKDLIRTCVGLHVSELRRSYFDPDAQHGVAGVDTLVKRPPDNPWFRQVSLWVQDEVHHLLADNKWGKATALFPNAKGLGVTATPTRADGRGLGRHADGLMDVMVESPGMRDLINMGFLTDYRIFAPPSDINLANVPTSASGDFSPEPLRAAVHKSHIVGDAVQHYLRIAPGKLGVTFAVDVESATEIAAAYRQAGVPAEVVSANTPPALRAAILARFARGELKQLVNVDLFGEGFDLPAIEVVSMTRPTQSFALYCLDPETEVLTSRGWERSETALTSDSVVAFDANTGECRSVPVTYRIRRHMVAEERMVGVVSPHLDICVSDKHRIVVRGHSNTHWRFETAEAVAARRGMFALPVAGRGVFSGSRLSRAQLRFLGWFLSDGTRNAKTNAITISQSSAKTKHVDNITQALRGCGFKFNMLSVARQGEFAHLPPAILFTISHGAPRGRDKHLAGYAAIAGWCDKSLPACYDALTREELLVLLETLNLGDGWNQHKVDWTPRTLQIACGTNQRMADRLQALCVTRGLRCNVSTDIGPNGALWHTARIKDTCVSTVAGTGTPNGSVGGKKPYTRNRFAVRAERPSFVWCLANELGTLITRRNGKVAIVGNCQQFGRSCRIMDGKSHAIIIDHVSNVMRHGLPDAPRVWTLDRRERRSRGKPDKVIPVRTCPSCLSVYERIYRECPFCGHYPEPAGRSGPEMVDGDLAELSPEALARLRGEIDKPLVLPYGATPEIAGAVKKRYHERQVAQGLLREAMAQWGGVQVARGLDLSQAQRLFYITFGGIDVASAQALGRADADTLMQRIKGDI